MFELIQHMYRTCSQFNHRVSKRNEAIRSTMLIVSWVSRYWNILPTQLSEETEIPIYQISKWKIEWEKDHTFVPGSNFGRHKRVFTETEEKNIYDFIRAQYIKTGIMVRRKHLKRSFMIRLFSNHIVRNFCKRNGFSFRMMRKKKGVISLNKKLKNIWINMQMHFINLPRIGYSTLMKQHGILCTFEVGYLRSWNRRSGSTAAR